MSAFNLKHRKPNLRYWWLLPLSGLVLIGLGCWILLQELPAYLIICAVFGPGILITGITELLFATLTKRASGVLGWVLLGAFIDLFAGIYLYFYPLVSLIVVPVILGFWLMLRGILAMASAWEIRRRRQGDWAWLFLSGLLILLLSVVLLADMVLGTGDIFVHIAIGFLFAGLFRLYLGFRLKALEPQLS